VQIFVSSLLPYIILYKTALRLQMSHIDISSCCKIIFEKASLPGLVYGISYPRETDCRVGSPKIRVAVEHSAKDSQIVIYFIREYEMCFGYSLHKMHVTNS
jgi:hypothetical protein